MIFGGFAEARAASTCDQMQYFTGRAQLLREQLERDHTHKKKVLSDVQNGMSLCCVPKKFLDDPDIWFAAMRREGIFAVLTYSTKMRPDKVLREIMKLTFDGLQKTVAQYSTCMSLLNEAFSRKNFSLPFQVRKTLWFWILWELQTDELFVLAAMQQDGLALQIASANLQAKKLYMIAALQLASGEVQVNEAFLIAVMQQDGLALQLASTEHRADKKLVLAAVQQNGLALQFASSELQADENVVFAAVQQNGLALQFASANLWNNEVILLDAVQAEWLSTAI